MADFSRRNCGFGWCRHLHGICRGSVRRRLSYGSGRARAAWRGLWGHDDRRRPWPYAALSHPRFFCRDLISICVVAAELAIISFILHRFMDTPFLAAAFQVVVGGVLVFIAGIAIGSS